MRSQLSFIINDSAMPIPGDLDALLATARQLQRADDRTASTAALRGKKLGLLCESEGSADARLFRSAAAALGASVTHIRPSVSELGGAGETDLLHTARVLGRLYDAIECQSMAPALVQRLGREAGVPVFDGVASPSHPTASLARLLEGPEPSERKRLLVVQAVLLHALR